MAIFRVVGAAKAKAGAGAGLMNYTGSNIRPEFMKYSYNRTRETTSFFPPLDLLYSNYVSGLRFRKKKGGWRSFRSPGRILFSPSIVGFPGGPVRVFSLFLLRPKRGECRGALMVCTSLAS